MRRNDPDPHQSERWDPGPHQSEKVDPDLHQGETDLQHCQLTHDLSVTVSFLFSKFKEPLPFKCT
jgi:hypothetical protein